MITDVLGGDYEEPSPALEYELRYADLLSELERASRTCLANEPSSAEYRDAAMRLYVMTQAMPSVLLNYKICIQFGLPLHPTKYIDFVREEKNPEAYLPSTRKLAQEHFLESLEIARSVYRLDPDAPARVAFLRARLPEFLSGFLYTSTADRYTWRASEPARVQRLAQRVRDAGFVPDLVLGAAHGSIRPAILLANLLGCPLYFLRCSLFKRDDGRPILSGADDEFLARFRDARVLLFDEDVAKGLTLRALIGALEGRFAEQRCASVLRHYLAPMTPDFVGEEFYD